MKAPFIRACISAITLSLISSATIAEEKANDTAFSMNTTAFLNQGMLPTLYTCDGKDISPELTWTNPPAKTNFFAIVVSDPKDGKDTFYHWVVFNLPKSTKKLAQGTTSFPGGTIISKNSYGKTQYNGPCPPHDTTHTYHITLYALSNKINANKNSAPAQVTAEIQKSSIGKTELTMVYSRWFKQSS